MWLRWEDPPWDGNRAIVGHRLQVLAADSSSSGGSAANQTVRRAASGRQNWKEVFPRGEGIVIAEVNFEERADEPGGGTALEFLVLDVGDGSLVNNREYFFRLSSRNVRSLTKTQIRTPVFLVAPLLRASVSLLPVFHYDPET